jgi:hypothetical protein
MIVESAQLYAQRRVSGKREEEAKRMIDVRVAGNRAGETLRG